MQAGPAGTSPPPRPSEIQWNDAPAGVPQRERVTYLSHLQARLGGNLGVTTGFATINSALVLNVIPVQQQGQHGPMPKARTVACGYDRKLGEWWFYWLATGEGIAPANELGRAARIVLEAATAGMVAA